MKPDYDRLYEFAEEQAGYFTSAQARIAGFSWERLSNSVKSGKFQRSSAGVYRLAHFPSQPHEDLYFLLLSAGTNAVISHESALSYYDLSDVLPASGHVIVPRTGSRGRKNIKLHTNQLSPEDITNHGRLRITTVARTIADVAAGGLQEELVRQALREALSRGMVSRDELISQALRRGGRARKIILDELNKKEMA